MKFKNVIFLTFFLILSFSFLTCTSNPPPTPTRNTTTTNVRDELDIAIREASNYLNSRIPQRNKVVFLNIQSIYPDLSEYILSSLSENAVNDMVFSVVDRQQLDVIRAELNFQLSGEVSDESAQSIGRMLGAQSIVSGTVTKVGTLYRLQVKAIEVQTAAIQGQWSKNIPETVIITALTKNQRTSTVSSSPSTTTSRNTPTPAPTNSPTPRIEGIVVPGANLSAKLVWLERSGDSNNTYILDVNTNEIIDHHSFNFYGATNITIILRGIGANRTIRLRSQDYMFTVKSNVTFILENNITLQGLNNNYNSLILVDGGIFRMNNGSNIIGNNNSNDRGGGVNVWSGTFEMNGGIISGNTAAYGGGVFVHNTGNFTMRGGTITGNTARMNGGGVCTFGTFVKTGGTITGHNTDRNNGNVVKDLDGFVLARKGHAIYGSDEARKETTAGSNDNLTQIYARSAIGAWDN